MADFVNSKFFVCLHFKLASFLQGLLLDERNLKDASRGGDVITPNKEKRKQKSTILFISVSTSSSFSGLDAIVEERQISWDQGRRQDDRLPVPLSP